jgi:hypothetical protein
MRWGGLLGRRYGHTHGGLAHGLKEDEASLARMRRDLAILENGGHVANLTIAGARGAIEGLTAAIRNKKNLLKARRP